MGRPKKLGKEECEARIQWLEYSNHQNELLINKLEHDKNLLKELVKSLAPEQQPFFNHQAQHHDESAYTHNEPNSVELLPIPTILFEMTQQSVEVNHGQDLARHKTFENDQMQESNETFSVDEPILVELPSCEEIDKMFADIDLLEQSTEAQNDDTYEQHYQQQQQQPQNQNYENNSPMRTDGFWPIQENDSMISCSTISEQIENHVPLLNIPNAGQQLNLPQQSQRTFEDTYGNLNKVLQIKNELRNSVQKPNRSDSVDDNLFSALNEILAQSSF